MVPCYSRTSRGTYLLPLTRYSYEYACPAHACSLQASRAVHSWSGCIHRAGACTEHALHFTPLGDDHFYKASKDLKTIKYLTCKECKDSTRIFNTSLHIMRISYKLKKDLKYLSVLS